MKEVDFLSTIAKFIIKMLFTAVPAIIVFCCFYKYRHRALDAMRLKSSVLREFGLILFVGCIFGILGVTLEPAFYMENTPGIWGDIEILIERPSLSTNVTLIPFAVFKDYIKEFNRGHYLYIITNFLGNLLVFVPIGLFPALLFRNATFKRSVIIGFLMSVFVEIMQYFIMRNTATDDVILNTLGAVIGYFVYLILKRFFPNFTNKFVCEEMQNGEE